MNDSNSKANYKKHFFTDREISEKVISGEYSYNTLLTLNEASGSKRTVLNFAARHGYLNTIAALRDAGLSAEQIDQTFPLFTAAKNSQIAAMEALIRMDDASCCLDLEVQVRENGRNRYYTNMLFYFFDYLPKVTGRLQEGHIRAFWVLVYYGINLEMMNKMGRTIIDLVYLNRVKKEVYDLIEYASKYFGIKMPNLASLDELYEFFQVVQALELTRMTDSYGFVHCFA